MPELQNGQYLGRFFSYPQGIVSFLPTLLSFVAAIANFWMFWDHPVFLCLQTENCSDDDSCFLSFSCFSLYITNTEFWDERDDDMQFAYAQAAAVMAVMAAVAGGVTTVYLVSASCFELQPSRLLVLAITVIVCAVFTFGAVFVAVGVDPCKDLSTCERYKKPGMRLAEGSVAAFFAAFFYSWAAVTVLAYRRQIGQESSVQQQQMTVQETAPMINKENQVEASGYLDDSDTDMEHGLALSPERQDSPASSEFHDD